MHRTEIDLATLFPNGGVRGTSPKSFSFSEWNAVLREIQTRLRSGELDQVEKRRALEALGKIEGDLDHSWMDLERASKANSSGSRASFIGEIARDRERVLEQLVRLRIAITANVRDVARM